MWLQTISNEATTNDQITSHLKTSKTGTRIRGSSKSKGKQMAKFIGHEIYVGQSVQRRQCVVTYVIPGIIFSFILRIRRR